MLKNYADTHIITSVCSGILACQYGINTNLIVTTYNVCYRDVLEQLSFLWFKFIGDIMYPQWYLVQEKAYFCNIVKGMEQSTVLALFICIGHFMMNCGDF